MKIIIQFFFISFMILSCTKNSSKENVIATENKAVIQPLKKQLNETLPNIGILIFEGVIINEVVAPLDVFSNLNAEGEALFNVITLAKEDKIYSSAHGLKIKPDFILSEVPELNVLVVPSSYTPEKQTADKDLVNFIKEQNKTTEYIASHCAGAFLVGASGIADEKKIVTYVGGGTSLKRDYPNLEVADDRIVSVIQDGRFISSNGSLVSYIASLDLLEKMTTKEHREYVEEAILFNRLKSD